MKFHLLKVFSAVVLVAFAAVSAGAENLSGGSPLQSVPSGSSLGASVFKSLSSEDITDIEPADASIILSSTKFEAGKSYPVILKIDINGKYHINSNQPANPSLIPTNVTFTVSDESVTIGRVIYPKPELKKFSFSKEKLSVYEGAVLIQTSLTFNEVFSDSLELKAVFDYQACTDTICLLPKQVELKAKLIIGTGGEAINDEIFAQAKTDSAQSSPFESASGFGLVLLVFLGGLALNLTPCIYPIIPVTVGFFGSASGRSRGQTVSHAAVYILGMAVMYSALGTVAALTGSFFGELTQSSFVILLLVGIMLALSLSMFGFYDIKVPVALLQLSSKSFSGLFGTFFMGITVGIIAAPCIGPFVVGLLTFVGERQDPLLGFVLFFVLSIGLGIPLLFLAVFSGGIQNLPKAGIWMEWVRKVFGVVLLGMALYFASPLIPPDMQGTLIFLLALGGAAYLIRAGSGIAGGMVFKILRTAIPLAIIGIAILFTLMESKQKEGLHFTEYSKPFFEQSIASGKPTIFYFTADWCVPCRELKIFTFTDKKVLAMAGSFTAIKADYTRVDKKKDFLKKEFGVKGVPTVIFFDKNGNEKTRFTGFVNADEFLKHLALVGLSPAIGVE